MRRKDREVTDHSEILAIMKRCDVCRIALCDADYPYIVPVNFGFETGEDGTIFLYFHGAKAGTKHALIEKNGNASFEMDCSHKLLPPTGEEACTASMAYESVIGRGEITVLAEEEKERALSVILQHYAITADQFNPAALAATTVYRIRCHSLTAKRRM